MPTMLEELIDDTTNSTQKTDTPIFDGSLASLENYLTEAAAAESGSTSDMLEIKSFEQADYLLGRVKSQKDEIKEIQALGKQKIETVKRQVEEWVKKSTNNLNRSIEHKESMLRAYAAEQLKDAKNKRSLNFTNGTIGFRSQQPSYTYDDDEIKSSLRKIPKEKRGDSFKLELVETVNKTELKKHLKYIDGVLTFDGIPVNGVTIEAQPDAFYTK